MIFKNLSTAADLLSKLIKEANFSNFSLVYINSDSKDLADLVSANLDITASLLADPKKLITTRYLIIIDLGNTIATEYNEFTDIIRRSSPEVNLCLAIPVIPESEKEALLATFDQLFYLHADPYFFSVGQFFEHL